MTIDHINIKIFAREPALIDLGDAIGIFHRWIQNHVLGELLIDVADYRHVPRGPGVMLIGHEASYSLDLTGGCLGLLYNRKEGVSGDVQDKLRQAWEAALAACQLLEQEAPFRGKLTFDAGECEVIFNDRLLTPNSTETYQALEPELRQFFAGLWGEGAFTLEHAGEPRERLRVRVRRT